MKKIFAEIITIGDEILYGQITDTNSQWMSYELDKIGIKTIRKSSVGDDEAEILQILKEAEGRADLILITGGLGPTKDDITKKTLALYFDSELKVNDEALDDVTEFFRKRGRELTGLNQNQALLPDKSQIVRNRLGTAPGMWFEKGKKVFVSMPGVPFEMKGMMEEVVLNRVKAFYQTPFIEHRIIRTIGIGESFLAEKIEHWEESLPPHMKLAYLPSIGEVKLRITAFGDEARILGKELDEQTEKLLALAGKYVYAFGENEFEKALGDILRKHKKTIAFAESCTGGFISYSIARIPGASDYFKGSVVAYQNEVKVNQLGVKEETLQQHGAVSEDTVKEMARGVRQRLGADVGIATSGIAGPGGGTPEKPVGTIWIAYDDGQQVIAKKLHTSWTREVNIRWAMLAALNLVRLTLDEIEP